MANWLRRNRSNPARRRPELPLPHDRDESSEGKAEPPRPIIEQARRDIESGKQDTDLHGTPGLEKPHQHRQ